MSTISVNVPETLRDYLEQESRRRGYKDVSEFIAAVIEAERFRSFREELESSLVQTLKEPSTPLTDEDFDDVIREGTEILKKRRQQ